MSVTSMSLAFYADLQDVEIPDGETVHVVKASTMKLVLLALADHANDDGGSVYPCQERLCAKTCLQRRTVGRALEALQQLHIIEYVGKSDRKTDSYIIIFDNIPQIKGWGTKKTRDSGTLSDGTSGQKTVKNDAPESHKSSLIQPSIKSVAEEVNRAYEKTISPLTPFYEEELKKLVSEHGEKWVIEALEEAARNGKRSLNYARAFLNRWKAEGYGSPWKNGQRRYSIPEVEGLPTCTPDLVMQEPDESIPDNIKQAWRGVIGQLRMEMPPNLHNHLAAMRLVKFEKSENRAQIEILVDGEESLEYCAHRLEDAIGIPMSAYLDVPLVVRFKED